jgi:predicted metal-dependent peptidase
MKIVDVELNDVNGGSFRVFVMNKDANQTSYGTAPLRDVADYRVESMLAYEKSLNLSSQKTWDDFMVEISNLKTQVVEFIKQAKKDGTSPSLNAMLDDAGELHSTWKEFDELSEADKRLVKAQIDHQIKTLVESQDRSRGLIPSELESYINGLFEEKAPSYDWKGYFRRFFGSSSKIYTKKTRRKLNKRFEENPALKIKPKKKVLIGIDTSGSVSNKDLIEFFSEINHMYKTGISITIAEGDATVQRTYEYEGKLPENVRGRGGTNMNPFIEYFNEHKQYNSLIILTDGAIGEKTVNTFKPMLMVLCSAGETVETVQSNGWGNVIKIQEN